MKSKLQQNIYKFMHRLKDLYEQKFCFHRIYKFQASNLNPYSADFISFWRIVLMTQTVLKTIHIISTWNHHCSINDSLGTRAAKRYSVVQFKGEDKWCELSKVLSFIPSLAISYRAAGIAEFTYSRYFDLSLQLDSVRSVLCNVGFKCKSVRKLYLFSNRGSVIN